MKRFLLCLGLNILQALGATGQPCSVSGNQTSYGTNNVWIGYVYNNQNLSSYRSYVNEGTAASPNFDQDFGGADVSYVTTGCWVRTETFSVRYKLRKTFAPGIYVFTVGGDDGFRFSLDGGSTWAINAWWDQSYTTQTLSVTLSGSYDMVLEYYERSGDNRISFSVTTTCSGTEDTGVYGTGNIWNGYLYDGTSFNTYSGMVNEGSGSGPDFDQNFGGNNTSFPTSGCPVNTETFSARYRLTKTFASGSYLFTVGGDDGYRLSVDGGATWIINNWTLHSYTTTSYSVSLSGSTNLVLEYYENSGENRISFSMTTLSVLPITLQSFTAQEKDSQVILRWAVNASSDSGKFDIERSIDGTLFARIGTAPVNGNNTATFHYTDLAPFRGVAYYRLKMTDISGKFTYSEIIRIRTASASPGKMAVYPTVVTGNTFFVVSQNNIRNAVVTITGLNGTIVSKQNVGTLSAGQAMSVSAAAARSGKGVYLVTLSGADFGIATSKIIIQ